MPAPSPRVSSGIAACFETLMSRHACTAVSLLPPGRLAAEHPLLLSYRGCKARHAACDIKLVRCALTSFAGRLLLVCGDLVGALGDEAGEVTLLHF